VVSGVTATINGATYSCPSFTAVVTNAQSGSSGGTKYPS